MKPPSASRSSGSFVRSAVSSFLPALLVLGGEELELMSGASFQPASSAGSSRESPGDDGNVHVDAPVPEGGPQRGMFVSPASQLAIGLPAGRGVDESGPVRASSNGQFPWREEPNGRGGRASVGAGRKSGAVNAEVVAIADLVALVRQPGALRLLDDGIEREQAAP